MVTIKQFNFSDSGAVHSDLITVEYCVLVCLSNAEILPESGFVENL